MWLNTEITLNDKGKLAYASPYNHYYLADTGTDFSNLPLPKVGDVFGAGCQLIVAFASGFRWLAEDPAENTGDFLIREERIDTSKALVGSVAGITEPHAVVLSYNDDYLFFDFVKPKPPEGDTITCVYSSALANAASSRTNIEFRTDVSLSKLLLAFNTESHI